jgi:hypothetical protein
MLACARHASRRCSIELTLIGRKHAVRISSGTPPNCRKDSSCYHAQDALDKALERPGKHLLVLEHGRNAFGDATSDTWMSKMTFDDPQMYTKPFTIKIPHNLMADADIFEDSCDNEKDRAHLGKK